jgi:lysylphosphatidylglycerol synthetase-like protein (DUF2156 family)
VPNTGGGGTRSGVLFPISGSLVNINFDPVVIVVGLSVSPVCVCVCVCFNNSIYCLSLSPVCVCACVCVLTMVNILHWSLSVFHLLHIALIWQNKYFIYFMSCVPHPSILALALLCFCVGTIDKGELQRRNHSQRNLR